MNRESAPTYLCEKGDKESFGSLETAPLSHLFFDVTEKLIKTTDIQNADQPAEKEFVRSIEGFEDVIGEQLGEGRIYNHYGGTLQLCFALSISSNPVVESIINGRDLEPAESIRIFREAQVLSGLKIIDLGCGRVPGFALAAKALGAKVYAVDFYDLTHLTSGLDGFVRLDLNDPQAADTIKTSTGGGFDLVSEDMVAEVPSYLRDTAKLPSSSALFEIAKRLLKTDGYYYGVTNWEILKSAPIS